MIRPYEPRDLPVVMDIANRAWKNIYVMFRRIYGDELFKLIVPDEKTSKGEQVRKKCETDPERVFVCERDGKIAGFVTFVLQRESGIGVICNNAKDPDCGHKGVGREMYLAVLDYFRREGMVYAKVGTGLDEAHAPARRAYEAVGFDIKHPEVVYYRKL